MIVLLKAQVKGYTRKDGTYVKPHNRRSIGQASDDNVRERPVGERPAAKDDKTPTIKKKSTDTDKQPNWRTAEELEADGFTEAAYAGTAGSPATKIYGYKENTPGENYFGGIFASNSKQVAMSHGDNLQEFRYKPESLLDDDDFRQVMYHSDEGLEKLKEALKDKHYETLDDDELEDLGEFLVGDKNINDGDEFVTGNERLGGILGYHEDYEIDFALQGLRGEVARRLGYSVVEMPDEHGTSLLVLGGDGVEFVHRDDELKKSIFFFKHRNSMSGKFRSM